MMASKELIVWTVVGPFGNVVSGKMPIGGGTILLLAHASCSVIDCI